MEVEEKTVYTAVDIADELNFRVRSEWKYLLGAQLLLIIVIEDKV